VVSGDAAGSVDGAVALPTPRAQAAVLSPLISTLPAQLVAVELARARQFDLDRDSGLSKVTHSL
jgi:fructoselysine-6-P-deglycase FrlB-like protein